VCPSSLPVSVCVSQYVCLSVYFCVPVCVSVSVCVSLSLWECVSHPSPPAFSLSQIRIFSSESGLPFRWPKYWSFSFSLSPSNEYSELISFRIHWLNLLAVQGTRKSLLQHHSSKASICHCSAFFMVQLSHPYMTTAKTIALTI